MLPDYKTIVEINHFNGDTVSDALKKLVHLLDAVYNGGDGNQCGPIEVTERQKQTGGFEYIVSAQLKWQQGELK